MTVWCTIIVTLGVTSGLMPDDFETAAKGKVLQETGSHYLVDFSEYAKKQKYIGNYNNKLVDKDKCLVEN